MAFRDAIRMPQADVDEVEQGTVGAQMIAIAERELAAFEPAAARERFEAAADRLGASLAVRQFAKAFVFGAFAQRQLQQMLAGHRASPDQFTGFANLCTALGIKPSFDAETERLLHHYAALWRVENGELPTVDAGVHLQKGETCHYASPADWLEYRKTTQTVGWASSGVSIRVMSGVYYHVGASRPQRIVSEGLAQIETGTVYLTSKRVIFSGQVRNFNVKLDAILDFHAFADGFAIKKGTGKHPHIRLRGDAETACVLLAALLVQSPPVQDAKQPRSE